MKNYQEKLNELLKEDYTAISKLYLLYELQAFEGADIGDDLLNMIYEAYLKHKNYNSIYDYVLAIQEWCECNDTELSEIKDYRAMLDDIY